MKLFNETAPTERGWEGVPVSLSVRRTPLLKAFLVPFSREPDWRAHFFAAQSPEGGWPEKTTKIP